MQFWKIILLVLILGILVFFFLIQKIPLSKFQKMAFFNSYSGLQANSSSPRVTENSSPQILEKMTLEQKIGQLFIIGFEGKKLNQELEDLIKKLHPGGILLLKRNIESEEQLRELIESLQEIAKKDIGLPLFVAVDQEGGEVCRIFFLDCVSQAEIENEKEALQLGFERAKVLKRLGVNLNLAPVLDEGLSNDFIYQRTFQTDTERAGELAKNLILGQKIGGILTAIKHFPGYGGIDFNPEKKKIPFFSEIPEISQFQKAIAENPEIVMVANAIYEKIDPKLPFSLSSKGTEFLKEKLGKEILIISDDLSSQVLKKEFSLEKTIVLAQKAGIDILLVAGFYDVLDPIRAIETLITKIREGKVSKESIENKVLKIIQLKQNLEE